MVFTVNLKQLSFKQDLSNLNIMLTDQVSTYAILRYAQDVPDKAYQRAMNILLASGDNIGHRKLRSLVMAYGKVAGAGMTMDEELEETIECWVGFGPDANMSVDGIPMQMTME